MRAETVHVAVAGGNAAVAHHDGDLVQRFRQQGPPVPVVGGAAQVGAWVALDHLVEVGELARVADEEHRGVVAHHVPVAFLGVELQREAADVALGIGRAALAGDGGEAGEQFGLLADFLEQLGAGVAGDVLGDGERAERARALGVHAPLRDHLAHEVGQLLIQPHILCQQRAAWAGGEAVLIVGHRRTEVSGQVSGRILLIAVAGLAHDRSFADVGDDATIGAFRCAEKSNDVIL